MLPEGFLLQVNASRCAQFCLYPFKTEKPLHIAVYFETNDTHATQKLETHASGVSIPRKELSVPVGLKTSSLQSGISMMFHFSHFIYLSR